MPIQRSTNPDGGIFQNIVSIVGSSAEVATVQGAMAAFSPYMTAVYAAVNALPEGELKTWLQMDYITLWKKVFEVITGRKYNKGDYTLAERMNDQINCKGNIDQTQATNDQVEVAHRIFNQLFGVRIATSEDLDALDFGVAAYKGRPVSQDIGIDAIERAVFLKQRFYPISTYNERCWDLKYFEIYPLVGKIPDYEIGKWYSGPLVGGPTCVDGLIPINAQTIIKQIIGGDFDPNTGFIKTPEGAVLKPGASLTQGGSGSGSPISKLIAYVKANPMQAAAIGAAVGYALYEGD